MRKLISALCVAGVLACNLTGVTMNADAAMLYCKDGVYPVFTLTEGEYGAAFMTAQTKSCHFIAVTDGSTLEGKTCEATNDDTVCAIWEQSRDYILKNCDSQTAELLSGYDENARYYRVYMHNTQDVNRRSEIGRKFMLEHENVQDVILYDTQTTYKAKWNGFSMLIPYAASTEPGFSNQNLWDVQEQFGGIYTWQRQNDQYLTWQEQLKEWKSTTDTTRMTEEEIYNSRKAAGIPTDYEMMKYAYDDGEIVKEQYPDLEEVAVIQPLFDICGVDLAVQSAYSDSALSDDTNNIENYGQVTTQNAQSAWDGIGDTNGNAEVDASDASMILEYAAQAGTSAVTASSVNAVMADVNADGVVNALDASLILTYSAQKGAGENISLHDVCRNK